MATSKKSSSFTTQFLWDNIWKYNNDTQEMLLIMENIIQGDTSYHDMFTDILKRDKSRLQLTATCKSGWTPFHTACYFGVGKAAKACIDIFDIYSNNNEYNIYSMIKKKTPSSVSFNNNNNNKYNKMHILFALSNGRLLAMSQSDEEGLDDTGIWIVEHLNDQDLKYKTFMKKMTVLHIVGGVGLPRTLRNIIRRNVINLNSKAKIKKYDSTRKKIINQWMTPLEYVQYKYDLVKHLPYGARSRKDIESCLHILETANLISDDSDDNGDDLITIKNKNKLKNKVE